LAATLSDHEPIADSFVSRNITIRRAFGVLSLFAALWTPTGVHAQEGQIQYSISNEFRYGNGEQFPADQAVSKEYFENLLNTRIYAGDFTLGFRVQVDKPREYGRDTIGITEYYAEFRREGLRARAGTFYQLVDRGLIFNTFESRPLGFETRTQGVKLDYEIEEFGAAAFGGLLAYPDITSATRLEEYLIRGASGEVRPIDGIALGGGYVAASGLRTRAGFSREFDAYLRQVYLRGQVEGLTAHVSLADKRTSLDSAVRTTTSSTGYGTGIYGMLGYQAEVAGLTAEYKNYRFDLVDPNEIQSGSRPTRALPFQYPPTLIPEHDKTLLARNPHVVDMNDEVGFQVEALVHPNEDVNVTLLGTAGSRHNAWLLDTNGTAGEIGYTRENSATRAFPELSDVRYSPYWEAYAGVEYIASEELALGLALQRRDNVLFFEPASIDAGSRSETYKATTLMLESIADLGSASNLHAIVELQQVFDSKKATPAIDSLGIASYEGRYYNAMLTLEFSRSPRWAVNARVEYSTTDKEEQGRQIWPVVGGTYRIGDAHTLGLQYGSERGGVVCTGGVCRYINPFTGVRLSIISKL
jgi:hypothetical protein